MKADYFIRKAHKGTPANKLQEAILSILPLFYNQVVEEPNTFFERLRNRVGYLNVQFPRCTPMKVMHNPLGQYRRVGGEQGRQSDQEQGEKHGWRLLISGLVEMELMPIKGSLHFDKPDQYAFMSVKQTDRSEKKPVEQMTILS